MNEVTTVCISSMDQNGLASTISPHFGKTPYFTLIRLKNGRIINVKTIEGIEHQPGSRTSTDIISDFNVDVVISGRFGKKAESVLREKGFKLFSSTSGKVKDVLGDWKVGNLPLAQENICKIKCCCD